MTLITCPREKELRLSIENGQWPDACSPELRAHVASCGACGDLVLVSKVFSHARAHSLAAARPVPAALVLWRAQLRRRNAAMERIGRPLLGAQIFAFAATLIAIAGFAGFEVRNGADWLTWGFWRDWFVSAAQANSLSSNALARSDWNWIVLGFACVTLALLGGLAVYLATERREHGH